MRTISLLTSPNAQADYMHRVENMLTPQSAQRLVISLDDLRSFDSELTRR